MAANSLNLLATKLAFVSLVCVVILAPIATARMVVVAEAPDPLVTEDFSLFPCVSFVPEAVKCMIDVFKHAIAPHPSCCKVISKLNDCYSGFVKDVSSEDMALIKSVCALWGVSVA